jgi:hypothetical protein
LAVEDVAFKLINLPPQYTKPDADKELILTLGKGLIVAVSVALGLSQKATVWLTK